MASVNQTRSHCVNKMGKTHSKTLAARHGRGMTRARHAMCESAFKELYSGFMKILVRVAKRLGCLQVIMHVSRLTFPR